MTARVAVVGAGISGVACAARLHAAGLAVEVLDRGRVVGGRMAVRTVAGRPVDMGASYLTASPEGFAATVESWVDRGLARPWTDRFSSWRDGGLSAADHGGPVRYGAVRGLRSLVGDLAARAGVVVHQQVTVSAVSPGADGVELAVTDAAASVGARERRRGYDAVVLAMPDPQAARLLPTDGHLGDLREDLTGRRWEPVLALAAGWERRTWGDLDGVFVNGHSVLSWVADDGRRRGDGAAVLTAHSTGAFAAPRLADPSASGAALLAATGEVLGALGPPGWSRVQRWGFAKPAEGRPEPYALVASVGVCGDGWGERSRVGGAWVSGDALGGALASTLG